MAKRYQRGNQNPYIEEEQTRQWPKDTKGLAIVLSVLLRYTDSDCPFGIFWPLSCLFFFDIRILIAIEEEQARQWPKDTKGAIRIRISKKNRQDNGQKIF
jgi:hypothetical protein